MFICFLAIVTLGCAVGLILLPVLLSLVGPIATIQPTASEYDLGKEGEDYMEEKDKDEENIKDNQCSSEEIDICHEA